MKIQNDIELLKEKILGQTFVKLTPYKKLIVPENISID